MKGLDRQQRTYFADFCAKFALMAAAALIFGQFVPEHEPSTLIVIVGFIITLGVILYGGYLQKSTH